MSSPPTAPKVAEFESIKCIEAMRNRLTAGETTFTLDELKLTLAWADHLNYFLAEEKRVTQSLAAALATPPAQDGAGDDNTGRITDAAMTAAIEAFERAPSLPLRFRIRCALACALPHLDASKPLTGAHQ